MTKPLKVLFSGTDAAGQCHTDAFRNVGAEVVGIVGRTESVLANAKHHVSKVAKEKPIPSHGTD